MACTSTPFDSSKSPELPSVHYDRFFGPLYFEPYALEVVKRIELVSASVVLEIAAGTGQATQHICKTIPPGTDLIASDLSEDMLAVAKKKLGHTKISWQLIDAQQLPFRDNSIDLVVCCFGFMFVPDKQKAFAEAYRVLKPGGKILFSTWDKLENNGASNTSLSIARKYLKKSLPESFKLATSMSEEAGIRKLLQEAGFKNITIDKVGLLCSCPSAKEAAYGLAAGPAYKEIKPNLALMEEVTTELETELAAKYGAAPMIAPMSALISNAWK